MARNTMKIKLATYASNEGSEGVALVDVGRYVHVQVEKLDDFDAPQFFLPSCPRLI